MWLVHAADSAAYLFFDLLLGRPAAFALEQPGMCMFYTTEVLPVRRIISVELGRRLAHEHPEPLFVLLTFS
jgi:hypothetical protein